ncbi:MAG TPA: 3-hydroxybutyrate dehydrogenase [Candidatus Limnocylindria bacterium]|jgi:3-hydroxybutyrate dehydrogenase
MSTLQGRRAIVTGAASGIGRAIAEELAGQGAHVLVTDINVSDGERVAASIAGVFVRADMSQLAECETVVGRAVDEWHGIDILVNNAGLQHVAPVEQFPVERWEHIVRTMLFGAFYLTRASLPHMYAGGWGRIVNIASVHGIVASPYKSAYVSAKHGLIGLTKTVALEAAEKGVTVNAVCPSYVRTPLVEQQIADQAKVHGISEDAVIRDIMLAPAALKRLLEPSEVAAYVRFLCSDEASGITGAVQMIDAGWTAR